MHWLKRAAALLCCALAAAPPASGQVTGPEDDLVPYAAPQRLVTLPQGRRMNIYCTGSGGPTILLEGGWTATTLWWRQIQARVARTTRVCSYDRAGYGFSDPGPLPRSAAAIADDLDALLKAAGERGPFILVAHSLGGLDARIFADRHPQSVKGLLLIEPAVPDQLVQMGAVSAAYRASMVAMIDAVEACADGVIAGRIGPDTPESRPCIDPPGKSLTPAINAAHRASQLGAGYQRTAASELASLDLSGRQVAASQHSWGAMPLIVMTAGRSNFDPGLPPVEQERLDRRWWELHDAIARLSARGAHRLIADASHFLPKDDPDVVVGAIEELVEQLR